MKIIAILLLTLVCGCVKSSRWDNIVPPSQIISFQSGDNQFAIIVVEDNDVSEAQAKETARQKAAQVTLDNGYRYFSIVSEKKTQVVKTSSGQKFQAPGNLYQELIFEERFSRKSLSQHPGESTSTYPAIRLTIECYHEKPAMKNSIDAQAYLNQQDALQAN